MIVLSPVIWSNSKWSHGGMSWSYRTGSPGPAHLSLDQRHWWTVQQPGGTKKTWRLSPTFLASFRTIKRGAPTVQLLPHHLPLLLCLFSDSLLLLQRGRAARQECTIPPPQGGSFCWVKRSRFIVKASRFRAPLLVFHQWTGLRWRRSLRGRWGGSEEESSILKPSWSELWYSATEAGVMCSWRGKRETATWIIEGNLTKRRSAEGICLPFIKTQERCEGCWQGGNLKKKLAEKDLSSFPDWTVD